MTHLDDTLLLNLYGSIEQEGRWLAVLDLLRERLGVQSAVAQVLSSARPCLQQVWTARDSLSLQHAKEHDSWANSGANPRFHRRPPRRSDSGIGSDFRSLDLSDREHASMREGLARCGVGPGFWVGFGLTETSHFSLVFHRAPGDDRDVDAGEEAVLQSLLPHLRQAVRLWLDTAETARRVRALEQAVRATDLAMVACDRAMRVAWHNPMAESLLAGNPHLTMRGGMLAAPAVPDNAALRALVADAASGQADVLALGSSGDDPLHVRAVAGANQAGIGASIGAGIGASIGAGLAGSARDEVLLLIAAPERRTQAAPADLARLFRLTGAEAQLAAALAAGTTLSDYAARRGITVGTARIQLKQLFGKTGTGRQADLVRLVLHSLSTQGERAAISSQPN
jgi:DNA-binding CsgD family transcriptional regulator